jgi:hypothetical protein
MGCTSLIVCADTNRTRMVRKTRPADSFFNFFSPPTPPSEEEEEDMDEDQLAELEVKLEVDYQIGEDFKEKVSSYPGLATAIRSLTRCIADYPARC